MGEDRSWMYNERKGRLFSPAWKAGLDTFLDHAFSLPEAAIDGKSKCPCTKCDCRHKRKRDEMEMHLCRNGFQLGYERWTRHGESNVNDQADNEYVGSSDRMNEMLVDAIGAEDVCHSEEPTKAAKELYELLEKVDKPLHDKTSHSRLSIVARLMTIKTQYNVSEAGYNETMRLLHEVIGDEAAKNIPKNFYRSKKFVHSLGMPYECAGRMPHGKLGIGDGAISMAEKEAIKTRKRSAQPFVSVKERRLERENLQLRTKYSNLENVVRALTAKQGMDFDALAQGAATNLPTSESEVAFSREQEKTVPNASGHDNIGRADYSGEENNGGADYSGAENEDDIYEEEEKEEEAYCSQDDGYENENFFDDDASWW